MKKAIVGYTGFVGSNICKNMNFDNYYNSKNVTEGYNSNPDLLIYAGIKAEKYIANAYPYNDICVIYEAIKNIKKINPKKIVLISTIDVYKNSFDKNEDEEDIANLEPYGLNRYYLEKYIEKNFDDYLIIRLPALFGINIKKNYIYDLKTLIPSKLKTKKYEELLSQDSDLNQYYEYENSEFYKVKSDIDKEKLKEKLKALNFTSLNFTDEDAVFQFFNLDYLADIIVKALKNNIKKLNIAVEPVKAKELYKYVYNEEFNNKISDNPPYYNFKTKYDTIFEGQNGYIFDKGSVLADVKKFIKE